MKLIKFEKTNCPGCAALNKFMKDIFKVEVDEVINCDVRTVITEELIEKYNIRSAPTLILVDDSGIELGRSTGMNAQDVRAILKKAGKI